MKKYKTVIVDDEAKSVDILDFMLSKYCPEINVIKRFTDPLEALEYLNNNAIDLLFLDIQMPQLDGFQLLDRLSVINFKIVFVTAYDEYALRAFKYYAIDYILKPVETEELKRLSSHLQEMNSEQYSKADYLELFVRMNQNQDTFEHLAVPTQSGVVFLFFNEILYLHADSNYTFIFRKDKTKVYASKTLKYFENLLPSNIFYRCHQSYVINVRFMKKFVRTEGGYLVMEDGAKIPLSRAKKHDFLKRYIN